MTDLPIYTAADGLATLILHEIPTKREGYILVRAVFGTLDGLLRECVRFCRGAGAERVYAGGAADFSGYPVFVSLIERSAEFPVLPQTHCTVEPVTQDTAERWAALYNERFASVPSAQSCGFAETRRLAQSGECYFVQENGRRVGLGRVRGQTLPALASLEAGAGEKTLLALVQHCGMHRVELVCALENARAMALYDRLGFSRGALRQSWYCVA